MDESVYSALLSLIASQAKHAQQRLNVIGDNLVQMGGVILETVVQGNATVSDDSALIAALQTAARTPAQGAIDTGE